MFTPLHRLYAFIQLRKKLKVWKEYASRLEEENAYLRKRVNNDSEKLMYNLERMHLKRQPIQMRHLSIYVSDYFRLMDSECYPLYAPLAKYLQRIGAYGDASNIWHLPNGAKVSITPNMSTGHAFQMRLMLTPQQWKLNDGWGQPLWIKPHPRTHITPQQVQEVVQALKAYGRAQGF